MDKLIQMVKLLQEKDKILEDINNQCTYGDMNSGDGLDKMMEVSQKYDQKLKDLLNEPVKVSKKQFMSEQKFHSLNYN